MSRITGVIVALATAATVLTGSTVGAAPPAPTAATAPAEVPREIEGGVELVLADGDLLRVWATEDNRAVLAKRHDATTGVWGPHLEVLRRKNLYCGDVDARTASGAVAVIALCDRGSYSEDTAPVSSRALWSPDTLTWSSYELEGEAYDEPGISPDGSNAVWPERQGYLTRTEAGFVRHALDTRGIEYTATATITDAEQVSYLYGAASGGRCPLVVLTRTGDGEPVRQEVPVPGGCNDSGLANVDADTVWFGDFRSPAQRTVVSRPDPTSPWVVSAIAPASAPGLDRVERRLTTDFFTAPGLPLVALSSAGGRRVRAQLYDRVGQAWGPAAVVHDAGQERCRWGDNWLAEPLAVLAPTLTCSGRHVVLTSRDGTTWQALRMGRHPYGLSPDGAYVAVPGRSRTHVISAERGVVTLPGGVTGRCDVVVPDGPDGAVLLTAAGRHRGWPTVLQALVARRVVPPVEDHAPRHRSPLPPGAVLELRAPLPLRRPREAGPGLHRARRPARRRVEGAAQPLVSGVPPTRSPQTGTTVTRTSIALVSLATIAALLSTSAAVAEPAPTRTPTADPTAGPTDGLPEPVERGVVVDLADGDRFKVTVARDLRTVWGARYDGATASWGARTVVLRKPDLFCGEVDARAAGTAVAILARCDGGGYPEESERTLSHALWSPDTVTWQSAVLPTWETEEPGISPSGNAAIWPIHDGWMTWTTAGFTLVEHELPGQEYSATATITDTGDVSVLYGGVHGADGQCADVIRVLGVSASGVETGQDVAMDHACSDLGLSNTSATTVVFGELSHPESVATISRADVTAPWAATGIAPLFAPGLVRHSGGRAASTRYLLARGLPLLAVGSADQKAFTVQSYDPVARVWSAPQRIGRKVRGCSWGDEHLAEPQGVVALRVDCGARRRLLVTTDARTWSDVDLGRTPLGVSPDGRLVSASNRVRTIVFSRERGRVRLPSPVRRRCDVVVPVSPDSAVRLTARRKHGYPARLDLSSPSGWRPSRTSFPRLRVGADTCVRAQAEYAQLPTSYWFQGEERGVALLLTPRGDGWKVRRTAP